MRLAWLTAAAMLLVTDCCHAATVPAQSPEHSLVKVRLAPGETAIVARFDNNRPRPVASEPVEGGLIFTGPPGYYTIIVQPLQWLEAEIVAGSSPTPPTPVPPAPPGPAPPIVPNTYGVGHAIYASAVKTNDPAGARILAEIFAAGAGRLAGLQAADIVDDVNTVNVWIRTEIDSRLGANAARWAPWRADAKLALTTAWRAGHQTRDAYVGVLDEISKALGAVK